jgi:disease resistance protein RPM1
MREEVASLKVRLITVESDLRDVDNLPVDQVNGRIKRWSREARDLSYDIEHVVDRFRARQLRARQLRFDDATAADRKDIIAKSKYKRAINKASRRFATEFRCHNNKLTELYKERPGNITVAGKLEVRDQDDPVVGDLSVQDDPVVWDPSVQDDPVVGDLSNRNDPVVGNLSVRDGAVVGELVGLQGRVEKLVSILTDEGGTSNRQIKVASILGMPGVGKTTLANQVYKRLLPRFECSAWVTVSTKPDVKTILRNMLSQIKLSDDANFGLTSMKETIDEIRKALKDKRYEF